jgi:hypothetical protein
VKAGTFLALVACGGAQRTSGGDTAEFKCNQRSASYTSTQSGDELGVLIACDGPGPHIKRWKVDKHGTRLEDAHSLSIADFEKTWTEIDGTGWRNLGDCPPGEKRDPIYVFDIKDDADQKSFQCQQPRMPYPYNDLVDPLTLLSQQGQHQLGDDEPADAKALDAKKPKK